MMRQASGDASTAAEAQALAREAIQSAREALGENRTSGYTVVANGDRITITVPNEEGATRTIQLSSDGSRIVSVEGISTRDIAPSRKALPDGLVPMMAIIFSAVTVMSLLGPLVKAFAKRFEKRGDLKQQALTDQRLAAIEQAIETVAVEVERISEGQRFTTKLLAEKAQPELERVR